MAQLCIHMIVSFSHFRKIMKASSVPSALHSHANEDLGWSINMWNSDLFPGTTYYAVAIWSHSLDVGSYFMAFPLLNALRSWKNGSPTYYRNYLSISLCFVGIRGRSSHYHQSYWTLTVSDCTLWPGWWKYNKTHRTTCTVHIIFALPKEKDSKKLLSNVGRIKRLECARNKNWGATYAFRRHSFQAMRIL